MQGEIFTSVREWTEIECPICHKPIKVDSETVYINSVGQWVEMHKQCIITWIDKIR